VTLRHLLDTSTLSWAIAPKPSEAVLRRLTTHGSGCAIAAPVWHELLYGCERLARGRRRAELEAFVHGVVRPSFPILPYDEAAASWHAGERRRLEKAGRSAPYADEQIAAIAHVNGLELVTTNVRHFAGFEGLRVVDWR
jgi:tRNA(fMet)-specific endonuclease VapC